MVSPQILDFELDPTPEKTLIYFQTLMVGLRTWLILKNLNLYWTEKVCSDMNLLAGSFNKEWLNKIPQYFIYTLVDLMTKRQPNIHMNLDIERFGMQSTDSKLSLLWANIITFCKADSGW